MAFSATGEVSHGTRDRKLAIATGLLALIAAYLFLRSAWLSDDAFISLRQVEMFVTGEGMVWNLGERVQAFTHPTWFLLLSLGRFVTGSLFYMTIALSALGVAGTLFFYWRTCRAAQQGLAVTILLMALPLLSIPFRDYMSSGLENPLSFLLVAVVFALLPRLEERGARRALWVILALAILNRQDLALQLGPIALWVFFRKNPLAEISVAAPGITLLVLWFAFATFYFGAPLPNTYFAKLSAGVPQVNLYGFGLDFFVTNLLKYPFSSATIVLGVLAGLASRTSGRLIAIGVLLHLVYLLRIGGDFMLGRFLSIDFLLACFLLIQFRPDARTAYLTLLAAMATVAVVLEPAYIVRTKLASATFDFVTDERQFYYLTYGMLSKDRDWPVREAEDDDAREIKYVAMSCGLIGGVRIRWPDSIFIVDSCGLTSPFLSRMPVALRDLDKMRTGHFTRTVPANIAAVVIGTESVLDDTGTRDLWRDVQLVTRGPLFSRDRLAAVLRLATGRTGAVLDAWRYPENAGYEVVSISKWLTPMPERGYSIYPSEAYKRLMEAKFYELEDL